MLRFCITSGIQEVQEFAPSCLVYFVVRITEITHFYKGKKKKQTKHFILHCLGTCNLLQACDTPSTEMNQEATIKPLVF